MDLLKQTVAHLDSETAQATQTSHTLAASGATESKQTSDADTTAKANAYQFDASYQ